MKGITCYIKRFYKEILGVSRSFKEWESLEQQPPQTLHIELTNVCNANCIFCGYQYEKRKKGIMPHALFSKCLKEYRAMGGKRIGFSPIVGEPLLDPDFVDRTKEAKSFGFEDIYAITNGILLYKHNLEALLRGGIDHLLISTAPLEKECLERIYRNSDYNRLLEGLEKVFAINSHLGNPVKISLYFRSDLSREYVFRCNDYQKFIRPYIVNEKEQVTILTKGYDNWGGMIRQEDLVGRMELALAPRYKRRPCLRTFSCIVTWDGYVRGCACRFSNLDKADPLVVGDLNNMQLKDIWSADKIRQIRRGFVKNSLSLTCRNCAMYYPA